MKKLFVLFSIFLAFSSVPVFAKEPSHTCYEVFVYSFFDTDGDGIGDLNGVNQKLDYIGGEDGLGCDMIWLMPVFPSPTYHKYDVTDYKEIDPQYGTLEDLDQLTDSCHEKGIRLILDMPLNHTSVDHPWFKAAADYLRSLGDGEEPDSSECPFYDYYIFIKEAKEGWAPLTGTEWYYEARFWEGMPDLNLDNEAVREEISSVISFWQDRGIDGFRLDAVPYYYTENREKSIGFVGWLNRLAKEKDPDCYLVGEAWTDQESYIGFYQSGIDSMFDFAFAGPEGVIANVTRGNRAASWFAEQMAEEEEKIGDGSVNAPFYTNHDMARSAGYYPDDGGARTKFALALNLLMPGNAFLYYGEELGMNGSGKDENKRAPMNWGSDAGLCSGPPEMDAVSMSYPSYEEQKDDGKSIYSVVRDAIGLRRRYPAIACGRTYLVPEMSERKEVCGFTRKTDGGQSVLVVINASEKEQTADLSSLSEESVDFPVPDTLILTPYAIAVIGEGEEEWTMLNEGCVLPEKKAARRR